MENQKLEELKASAYDCMANIQAWQEKLGKLNKMIAEEINKPKEVKPDVKKTDK